MMNIASRLVAGLAFFVGPLLLSANAQVTSYTLEGVVESTTFPAVVPSIWDSVQIGDPFTVVVTVDLRVEGEVENPGLSWIHTDHIRSVYASVGGVEGARKDESSWGRFTAPTGAGPQCLTRLELHTAHLWIATPPELWTFHWDSRLDASIPYCIPPTLTPLTPAALSLVPDGIPVSAHIRQASSGLSLSVSSVSTIGVVNDDAANAIPVGAESGVQGFNTLAATTDGQALDPAVCDMGLLGDEQIYNDAWYCFTAPASKVYRVTSVGLCDFNTRVAVYDSDCGSSDPASVIACNDDFDGALPSEAGLTFGAVMGTRYMIRVGGNDINARGAGGLIVEPETEIVERCFGDGDGRACRCGNDDLERRRHGGCLNSAGTGAALNQVNSTSVTENLLQFRLSDGVPGSLAVLLSADNMLGGGLGILGMPPSDGLRCIGQNLLRHGARTINSNGTHSTPWGAPFGGHLIIGSYGFVAGQTRHFQARYRDDPLLSPCGFGTNTTQAISITFLP